MGDADSPWRDYKAVRVQGIYYSAFFQDNDSLIDSLLAQRLLSPLVCLGDGHDGVWDLFRELTTVEMRLEILDWYHLKENLYKVGGLLKRLAVAAALPWQGQVAAAKALYQILIEPEFGIRKGGLCKLILIQRFSRPPYGQSRRTVLSYR